MATARIPLKEVEVVASANLYMFGQLDQHKTPSHFVPQGTVLRVCELAWQQQPPRVGVRVVVDGHPLYVGVATRTLTLAQAPAKRAEYQAGAGTRDCCAECDSAW